MRLLKLENLVIAIYLLILAGTFVLLDQLRVPEKRGMPILLGVISMAFYLLSFRVWYRMAPSSSRIFLAIHAVVIALLFVPQLAVIGLISPVPMLFSAIFFAQRERGKGLAEWLTTNQFTRAPQVSAALLGKLGTSIPWLCCANSFSLRNGQLVPYIFWYGLMDGMTTINGRPAKVRHPVIAFSFSQQDVGERFMDILEGMELDKLGWFQRLRPSKQSGCPYLVDRVSDGSFVVAWGNDHTVSVIKGRSEMLRRILEDATVCSTNSEPGIPTGATQV